MGLWGQSQIHLAPGVAPVVACQENHQRSGWMTGKVHPPLEKQKKEVGELPAGWAAEGLEAPHGALHHLPKLPRTLMLGGDLNGSCAKR